MNSRPSHADSATFNVTAMSAASTSARAVDLADELGFCEATSSKCREKRRLVETVELLDANA